MQGKNVRICFLQELEFCGHDALVHIKPYKRRVECYLPTNVAYEGWLSNDFLSLRSNDKKHGSPQRGSSRNGLFGLPTTVVDALPRADYAMPERLNAVSVSTARAGDRILAIVWRSHGRHWFC